MSKETGDKSEKTGQGQSGGMNIAGKVGNVGCSIVGRDMIVGAPSAAALDNAMRPLFEASGAVPAEKRTEAEAKLTALKNEAAKGEKASDDKAMGWSDSFRARRARSGLRFSAA